MSTPSHQRFQLIPEHLPPWVQDFVGTAAKKCKSTRRNKKKQEKKKKSKGYSEPNYGDTSAYKSQPSSGSKAGCADGIGGTGISSTDEPWAEGYFGS